MNPENLFFILCKPEESRNIGSACRAMKTMGYSRLRIVGQKNSYDENQINTLALGAFSVWQEAIFFDSLHEAVADCVIAAGTTRRVGKKRFGQLLNPPEFAELALKAADAKVAVIFGNERTGLTDEELGCCTVGVTIQSNPQFGSLNLSHAVQIIAYELYTSLVPQKTITDCAALAEIEQSVSAIADSLEKIGFFKITGRTDLEHFWRNIFSRAAISSKEADYAKKIFAKTAALISHKGG